MGRAELENMGTRSWKMKLSELESVGTWNWKMAARGDGKCSLACARSTSVHRLTFAVSGLLFDAFVFEVRSQVVGICSFRFW